MILRWCILLWFGGVFCMSVRSNWLIVFKSCFLLDLSGHSIIESWKLKSIIIIVLLSISHNNSVSLLHIFGYSDVMCMYICNC